MGFLSTLGLTRIKTVNKKLDDIEKAFDDDMAKRVRLDEYHTIGEDDKQPFQPIHRKEVRDIVYFSDILRTTIRAITESIFKNGYEIKEKVKDPSENQKVLIEKVFKDCNENDQTIVKCLKMFENDINTYDDGYLLCVKDYRWNGNIITGTHFKELVRIEPLFIWMMADDTGRPAFDNKGNELSFCVAHRNQLVKNSEWCPVCGKMTLRAHYKGEQPDGTFVYYAKTEVLHSSRYFPSLTYGFPPPIVVWHKARALMYQDKYIHDYYAKQRQPKKLAFFNTPDSNGLKKMIADTLSSFRKNPHGTPIVGVNAQGKNKFVEVVDFMNTLEEMQFTETRDEFRRSIGALYGVMPMYTGDVKSSGGLNSEDNQIIVKDEAVATNQTTYNEEVFPWLMEQLNITDYEVILNENKSENLLEKLQIQNQEIQNAKLLQDMGFEITLKDDNTFTAGPTDKPVERPEQSYFPSQPNNINFSDSLKAEDVSKDKIYLKPNEDAPEGAHVQTGPKGGKYYESTTQSSQEDKPEEPTSESGNVNYKDGYKKTDNEFIDMEHFIDTITDDAESIGLFKKMVGKIGKEEVYIIIEEWNKGCLESRNAGKTTPKNIKNNYLRYMKDESGLNHPDEYGYIEDAKDGDFGVSYIIQSVNSEKLKGKLNEFEGQLLKSKDVFKSDNERNLALTALIKRIFDESTLDMATKPKLLDTDPILKDFIKTLSESLFDKTYKGITKENSNKINDVILKGLLDEEKIDSIKNKMQTLGAKEEQADMIFRTESSSLQNTMREWSFNKVDPEGKNKFKWIGPNDKRTTKHCKKIASRTSKGVSLEELKKIIKEEADPKIYNEDRPFIPHLQCRHRMNRVV